MDDPTRSRSALVLFGFAAALATSLLLVAPVEARRSQRVPHCPPGHYGLIEGFQAAESGQPVTVLELGAAGASLRGACAEVRPRRFRGTRSGRTKVRVTWRDCDGFSGRVRLSAKLDAGCSRLTGKLRDGGGMIARGLIATRLVDDGEPGAPGEDRPLQVLPGDPDAPAIEAIGNLSADPGVAPDDVFVSAEGARIPRTHVDIAFARTATLREVNALLSAYGARVLSTLPRTPVLHVELPDPGSLEDLERVRAALEAEAIVEIATIGVLPELQALPSNFRPTDRGPINIGRIGHLFRLHAPTAWNARGLMQPERVTLVIADAFGDGPPGGDFDVILPEPADFRTNDLARHGHGYHVLGIIAARYGSRTGVPCLEVPAGRAFLRTPHARGCVTGVFGGRLRVRAVDVNLDEDDHVLDWAAMEDEIIRRIDETDGNVVVNTSLGRHLWPEQAIPAAERWIRKVRDPARADFERRVFHATSAGYDRFRRMSDGGIVVPSLGDPNGSFDAAATQKGLSVPNLGNTLVVENQEDGRRVRPSARGMIGAEGTDVYSLLDADGTTGHCTAAGVCSQTPVLDWEGAPAPITCDPTKTGDPLEREHQKCSVNELTGTSMATAVVSGVAAFLWAVEPRMDALQLRRYLQESALRRHQEQTPGVDPYRAVLALDTFLDAPGTTVPSRPVRRHILDVSGPERRADDVFDHHDVTAFFDFFDAHHWGDDRYHHQKHQYSRRVLISGFARVDLSFDLNANLVFDETLEMPAPISRSISERNPNDEGVVCWYVYSDLYTPVDDDPATPIDDDPGRQRCCQHYGVAPAKCVRVQPEAPVCPPGSSSGEQRVGARSVAPDGSACFTEGRFFLEGVDSRLAATSFNLLAGGIVTTSTSGRTWRTVGAWAHDGRAVTIEPCAPRTPDFGPQPSRWRFEGVLGHGRFGACEDDLQTSCTSDADCGGARCIVSSGCCFGAAGRCEPGAACPGLIGHLRRVDAADADDPGGEAMAVRTAGYEALEPNDSQCAQSCDAAISGGNTGRTLCDGDCWPEWSHDYPHFCALELPREEFLYDMACGIQRPDSTFGCEGGEYQGKPVERACPVGSCTTLTAANGTSYCGCLPEDAPPCTRTEECPAGDVCVGDPARQGVCVAR